MAEVRRIGLDEVVRHFEELEDPHSEVNLRHPFVSVVVIALLAVLAGAGGPTAIARWALLKQEFLLQVLDLPNGIPRKDVFRRVLMAVKPAAFQACFADWLQSLRTEATAATGVEQPILPVDGKTARRSHDRQNGLGALHSVSVWASEFGLSLGQVACADKSNEITAIPQLLRLVDIKGAIITIDAIGTQKAIAAQIIEGGADYVLALKGNQETLHQAVIDYIDEQLEGDLADAQEHVTGWASRKWVEYFVEQRSLMYRLRFSSPLFTEGSHVLCPSSRRSGPARRTVVRVSQGVHRTRPRRLSPNYWPAGPTTNSSARPSSIFANSSIAWERRPSRPRPSSGKKGVPRLQHDLPPLPARRSVQGLSEQGAALGPGAPGLSNVPIITVPTATRATAPATTSSAWTNRDLTSGAAELTSLGGDLG